MPTPRAATTVQKTRNFDFLFGRYSHSKYTIPYFQISMTFNDAARVLNLVNEMPDAASMNWKIEELFQRDIDWQRVERQIVPYLKNQERPQFFNSLTIALLPIRSDTLGTFATSESWNAPSIENEEKFAPGTICSYGPITCGYWGQWSDPGDDNARLGQICWNTDQVRAIAIDGQHRLAAIKELVGFGGEQFQHSSVPVILLVFDGSLGFNQEPTREALIDTLRNLFIDLNKHAKIVNRARQILLDDRDPASICVRTAVGTQLASGVSELNATPPALPLSLIDWHSEQAKFDVGPYLATILGLDWAVAKTLGIRPFEDPMAHDKTRRLIDKLERKLGIELNEARDRLKECVKFERPFSFVEEPDELGQIGDGFRTRWCRPLVHLLSQFTPYRQLITLRQQRQTLCPEFANWYAMKQCADESSGAGKASQLLGVFESKLSSRDPNPVATGDLKDSVTACNDLKKERMFAFTVVFQRALVLAFLQLTKVTGTMVGSNEASSDFELGTLLDGEADGDDSGDDIEEDASVGAHEQERAEDLINALNHVLAQEPDFLQKGWQFSWDDDPSKFARFWLCSLVNPQDTIDFTQGASVRASEMLLVIGLMWLYREREGLAEDDFDELMSRADNAEAGLNYKFQLCRERMWAGDTSIAGRILKSRDQDVEDDDLRWAEIRGRLSWLWTLINR